MCICSLFMLCMVYVYLFVHVGYGVFVHVMVYLHVGAGDWEIETANPLPHPQVHLPPQKVIRQWWLAARTDDMWTVQGLMTCGCRGLRDRDCKPPSSSPSPSPPSKRDQTVMTSCKDWWHVDSARTDDMWTVQGLMTHGQWKNNLTSLQGTLGQLDFILGTLGQLDFTQGTRGQLYTRGYWDNFTLGDTGTTWLHSGGH